MYHDTKCFKKSSVTAIYSQSEQSILFDIAANTLNSSTTESTMMLKVAAICVIALAGRALTAPTNGTQCNPLPGEVGAVFAMTNRAANNEVIAFSRDKSGKLTQSCTFSTGGRGIGVDFDTQGGLTLSNDRRFLYAVSPGDDKVSVFTVRGSCLNLIQTVDGGDQPLSITLSNDLAYVLDGSVAANGITGFKVAGNGTLAPLPDSFIQLSSPIAVPGVIQFSPDGKAIVVTHKVGSSLDVFQIGDNDLAIGPITTTASNGPRPFSAIFRNDSILFVVESGLPSFKNAAVSSYQFNSASGALTVITKSEKNGQTDGCWIALTKDQRFAYTANFISGSIASYSIASNGTASLINGAAAVPGLNSNPVDLALSDDGLFIYDLLRGMGGVAGWKIKQDGSLDSLGVFGVGGGLPVNNGASGLAGY